MRVITKHQQVSDDRQELEKKADSGMLMRNCIQQSAKMGSGGEVAKAQAIAKAWNRNLRENLQSESSIKEYQNFNQNYGEVYNQLGEINEQQKLQSADGIQVERAHQNDKLSSMIYKAKNQKKQ